MAEASDINVNCSTNKKPIRNVLSSGRTGFADLTNTIETEG